MNKYTERVYNGIVKENPTFVLMLGMCPTLAVTTSAMNGLGMGLSTTVVLIMSNFIISALRKIIPDRVRIPLGIYIPLIVVNCIILGRAESYASKFGPALSAFDGIGMGIGFSIALTAIGAVRELIGSGSIFGLGIMPASYEAVSIFVLAPGAFFVLAVLTALQNKFKAPSATNGSVVQSKLACGGDCMNCSGSSCMSNHSILETRRTQALEDALEQKKANVAKAQAELDAATAKKD